jgi:hypothetical protein
VTTGGVAKVSPAGGEVVVLAGSGLLDGGSQVAITAKQLDVRGLMAGGTRIDTF